MRSLAMSGREHYFDWAATAPCDEAIIRKAMDVSLAHWGNPSSLHQAGTDAKKALEDARARAARSMGVQPETVFFTSGGTESDHIPLLSVLARPQKGSIVLSAIEHPALREMARMIQGCGWKVITVNPGKNGIISAQSVASAMQDDTAFVTVMAVNNETGAIQPVREIAQAIALRSQGKRMPLFHVDCVQAAGKISLDLGGSGIASASISAHKMGGPKGSGILYLAKTITPFLKGGGQEGGIRSGTESLFAAEAISLCLESYFISEKNTTARQRLELQREYTRRFIHLLKETGNCVLIPRIREDEANEELFSPWIVQAAFPGIPGQVMQRALSERGFFISTGSACSSSSKARPVLDTMQIPPKEKESAVRFSFGHSTSEAEMEELAAHVQSVCKLFNPQQV